MFDRTSPNEDCHRRPVFLRQVGALDADVDDRNADLLGFRVHRLPDPEHQLAPLARQHRLQLDRGENATDARIDDHCQALTGHDFVVDGAVELQRIGDPVAGVGVDHQPLLVRGDDLFLRRVVIENSLLHHLDVLDQRHLEMQTRLLDHTSRLTQPEHQCLLGLLNREEAAIADHAQNGDGDREADAKHVHVHCRAPFSMFFWTSGSGR